MTEKAIIFDLDGTLLDSMDAWMNVDKKFLAENEIEYPDGLEEKMKTLGYKDACQVFVDSFEINMTCLFLIHRAITEKCVSSYLRLCTRCKDRITRVKMNNTAKRIASIDR